MGAIRRPEAIKRTTLVHHKLVWPLEIIRCAQYRDHVGMMAAKQGVIPGAVQTGFVPAQTVRAFGIQNLGVGSFQL